jgi:Universal stress protein UspA and related nucleotide-binding proteins
MTKILLPTDGSLNAYKAGEYAIDAAELGSDILLLYVIDTDHLNALSQPDLRDKLQIRLIREGKKFVNDFKQEIEDAKCQGYCKHVNIITLIRKGKPEEVILKTIQEEDIDQVIIGKSNKSNIEKYFIGSITKEIAKKANIPVKII